MLGPGGPQGGTRETCNCIAAVAADGKPAAIVDDVPVYASPIGAGLAGGVKDHGLAFDRCTPSREALSA